MTHHPKPRRLEDLPIPEDARPNRYWCGLMLELEAHIGAYATLLLCDHFGGQQFTIPNDPAKSPFINLIGANASGVVAHVFGGNRIEVPTGNDALRRARMEPVLAAVRAKAMSAAEACRILRTGRRYLSHLINQTGVGADVRPRLPVKRGNAVQLELLIDE